MAGRGLCSGLELRLRRFASDDILFKVVMSMFQTLRRFLPLGLVCCLTSTAQFNRRIILVVAGLLAGTGCFSFGVMSATASSISYPGPLVGNTVIYSVDATHSVTESSVTDGVPLFGAPSLSGDSIDFNPAGFGSFAQNGALDVTDGQLTFMVTAKPGQAIKNIKFNEAGIVTLLGIGGAATSASDKLSVFINIQAVDGVGINSINLTPTDFFPQPIFTPKGSFNLAVDGPLNTAPWSGYLLADLQQVLVNKGIKFTTGITKISVNLDNQLMTTSERNTQALIDKKDFFIVTVNSPEPSSCVLALLAMLGAALFARRRSA
jgi:hypothetical protein